MFIITLLVNMYLYYSGVCCCLASFNWCFFFVDFRRKYGLKMVSCTICTAGFVLLCFSIAGKCTVTEVNDRGWMDHNSFHIIACNKSLDQKYILKQLDICYMSDVPQKIFYFLSHLQ